MRPETYHDLRTDLHSAIPRLVTVAYAKIGRSPKVGEAGVMQPNRLRLFTWQLIAIKD